jgi:hypothetical protein
LPVAARWDVISLGLPPAPDRSRTRLALTRALSGCDNGSGAALYAAIWSK